MHNLKSGLIERIVTIYIYIYVVRLFWYGFSGFG